MDGNKLFYYFGDDEAYFKTLVGEFKKFGPHTIDFKKVFETEEARIQSLFLLVAKTKPQCVFIDFSKKSTDYLHLARIITRALSANNIITVGLLDYLSPQEVMLEGIATGVNLNHIKSAESYDVVFSVLKLISPNDNGRHPFAIAKYTEEVEGGVPVKVGYINHRGLHIETDYEIKVGDKLNLEHYWAPKRIVPSKELVASEITKKNLFYNFEKSVDLDFLFIDELQLEEEVSEETHAKHIEEREEKIQYHKKILEKWIKDNESRSLEKKAKVLVIDRHFNFYNMRSRTDKHPYTIRCLSHLKDIGETIDRLEPQVLAFALDKEEDTEPLNTPKELKLLAEALKVKMGENLPFLIVFNSSKNSKTLQDELEFPHIVAAEGDLSVDLLIRMADVFEKKLLSNQPKGKAPKKETKVFLKNTNEASLAKIQIEMTIKELSEIDMYIETKVPLKIGTNVHLKKPVNMFISIQPSKDSDKSPIYHGIIHCIGEEEKMELRRYVNSVIFREHDAKVTAEVDEFKKLNEIKLQEKEAREKEEEES